jgi:hypothetical protein
MPPTLTLAVAGGRSFIIMQLDNLIEADQQEFKLQRWEDQFIDPVYHSPPRFLERRFHILNLGPVAIFEAILIAALSHSLKYHTEHRQGICVQALQDNRHVSQRQSVIRIRKLWVRNGNFHDNLQNKASGTFTAATMTSRFPVPDLSAWPSNN